MNGILRYSENFKQHEKAAFLSVVSVGSIFSQCDTNSFCVLDCIHECDSCLYLSNKSCRNWCPCGKVISSSPDSTPIILFCSSVTPTMCATCSTKTMTSQCQSGSNVSSLREFRGRILAHRVHHAVNKHPYSLGTKSYVLHLRDRNKSQLFFPKSKM